MAKSAVNGEGVAEAPGKQANAQHYHMLEEEHDVMVYAESGRVAVKPTGEGYHKSQTMDYWEGLPS